MQLPVEDEVLQLEEVEVAGDLVVQPRHVGDVVLDPEPQLSIPGTVDAVLVQLLSEGLVSVHPLKVLALGLVLESKVRNLPRERKGNRK